ncbi:MAG: hypothetical protein ACTSWC_01045 [Promethearchaeota archaeon]
MRKLILVRWDMRLGPNALVQFPPEASFPPNETLLQIWAKHETTPNSDFVAIVDEEKQVKYCSLLKIDSKTHETFFIILELTVDSDVQIYQEILNSIGNELITNYNAPHFTHILSETYRAIKNYSEMDEKQLYFRLFEDNTRIHILQILRQGVISKRGLREKLRTQFGYTKLNIDLLLTPFQRLRLIKIINVPGEEESIFLVADLFAIRIPPAIRPNNHVIQEKIQQFFVKDRIILETELHKLFPIFEKREILQLINLIALHNENGLEFSVGLELLKNKKNLLLELEATNIIDMSQENLIFLISDIQFLTHKPKFLLPILARRYKNEEISLDQLFKQLNLIL